MCDSARVNIEASLHKKRHRQSLLEARLRAMLWVSLFLAGFESAAALQPFSFQNLRCVQQRSRCVVSLSDGGPVEAGTSVIQDTEGLGSEFLVDDLDDWGPAVVDDDDDGDEDLLANFDLENTNVGEIMEWPVTRRQQMEDERQQHKQTYARHDTDCGSPELQIALFTARIKHATQHVIDNPKDYASRRGLLAMVSKRRRLLNYYYKRDPEKAEKLVRDLGIRFKFRAKLPTREEKYLQYTIRANRKRKN